MRQKKRLKTESKRVVKAENLIHVLVFLSKGDRMNLPKMEQIMFLKN
jgi:hypothetical protein